MMQSHPIHDNYVLISSDNHLRLFDLLSGTTLRVFATRHIEAGVSFFYYLKSIDQD